jgi:hypothetical protein
MLQSRSPFQTLAKKSVELTIAIAPAGTSFPAVWQELGNALARRISPEVAPAPGPVWALVTLNDY